MNSEPENTGNSRDENGRFIKGVSGNPAGKPKGTISIVAKIKKKFEENPEYFEEWVDKLIEDPKERRAIMEQIDGKPRQDVKMEGDLTINVIKYGKKDTEQ